MFPFHAAEQVLDQFRERFIKEVDAEAVVGDLVHNNVIDEGDERDITSAKNPTRQNQKLHLCLHKKCTLDALMTVCDIMMAVKGNPKMLALGEAMRTMLLTYVHLSILGTSKRHAHLCVVVHSMYRKVYTMYTVQLSVLDN